MLNRIGNTFSKSQTNANYERLEATGSYTVGRGLLQGCELSDGGSLVLHVGSGVYHLQGCSYIIDSTISYLLPASDTFSIWIDENGDVSHTTSDVDSGDLVCLGRVTTGVSTITVTTTGRVSLLRTDSDTPGVYSLGNAIKFDGVNARIGVGTASPTKALDVVGDAQIGGNHSVSGNQNVTGTVIASGHIPTPTSIATLTADLTLTKSMANLQILTASGANRKVILPSSVDWGTNFVIRNVGTSNNILVRDSGDTTTIATLTPGLSTTIATLPPSGGGSTPVWPSSATTEAGV